jgi:hypothetical protein
MDPYESSPAVSARGYGEYSLNSPAYGGAAAVVPTSPKAINSPGNEANAQVPLTISVAVRDVVLQIECGPGTQSCKWLASVATSQYALLRPETVATAYLPVHLVDSRGNALFPSDILCERVETGDTVRLELLGPRLGPNTPGFKREQSLWELYAYNSSQPHGLVPVIFLFDATELALTTPPSIFGNFNGWGTPWPMNFWKGNTYKFQMGQCGRECNFQFEPSCHHTCSHFVPISPPCLLPLPFLCQNSPPAQTLSSNSSLEASVFSPPTCTPLSTTVLATNCTTFVCPRSP